MEASLKPERLDSLDRAIRQLGSEQAALARAAGRRDRVAARALDDLKEQLTGLQAERTALGGQLEAEKEQSAAISALRCDRASSRPRTRRWRRLPVSETLNPKP